jgi:hypothetical protein
MLIFINSCDSKKKLLHYAEKNNFTQKIYHKFGFEILTLQKISDNNKPLTIYIEGDGFAYVNKYRASSNPTPRFNLLFDLIKEDKSPNIIYLARPCQYILNKKCDKKYWTSDRFSSEIIAAIYSIIDEFKDYKIDLIAYSSGAFIALQMKQKNINTIRTIAGNLDLESFVNFHKISPLEHEKIDYERLSKIPQIHFVGLSDKIISPIISRSYQEKLQIKNCLKIVEVENATHSKNWQKNWKKLLEIEVKCD